MDKPAKKTSIDKRSVRTTVSIPAIAYEEVERLAEQKKVSVAWIVRDAVDQYLAQHQPLFQSR